MKVGKIIRIGTSLAVVIPKPTLRRLGWWRGDFITQEVDEEQLVFRNVTQLNVRPIGTREEYGDSISSRSQRPVSVSGNTARSARRTNTT